MIGPVHFYLDDSGSRMPDRKPRGFDPQLPDHFALGGVLVLEENEAQVRHAHAELFAKWQLSFPLHSADIRAGAREFSWARKGTKDHQPFMRDLTRMLEGVPVLGLACVIDRPGADERYRDKYGDQRWPLCQTAYAIAVERAAKYARSLGRALRVYPEKCQQKDQRRMALYHRQLVTSGMPFNLVSSDKYAPLSQMEFDETLIEQRFKGKSSPPMQIADLYLWPIARRRYGREQRPYQALKNSGRLVECNLTADQVEERGTKYSCFELVDQAAKCK